MKQTKIRRGALPPLFDRIVEDKNGVMGNQLLSAQELQDSIIREVSLVLNTRCTVRKVIYEDHIETIPLFGLPDFFGLGDLSYFDGANAQEWPRGARLIETAIQAAEPRLGNIAVTIEKYDALTEALSLMVSASVKETQLLKEIHFPLILQHAGPPAQKAAA